MRCINLPLGGEERAERTNARVDGDCSGRWFLPTAGFLLLQRKLFSQMHLAFDGTTTPFKIHEL